MRYIYEEFTTSIGMSIAAIVVVEPAIAFVTFGNPFLNSGSRTIDCGIVGRFLLINALLRICQGNGYIKFHMLRGCKTSIIEWRIYVWTLLLVEKTSFFHMIDVVLLLSHRHAESDQCRILAYRRDSVPERMRRPPHEDDPMQLQLMTAHPQRDKSAPCVCRRYQSTSFHTLLLYGQAVFYELSCKNGAHPMINYPNHNKHSKGPLGFGKNQLHVWPREHDPWTCHLYTWHHMKLKWHVYAQSALGMLRHYC